MPAVCSAKLCDRSGFCFQGGAAAAARVARHSRNRQAPAMTGMRPDIAEESELKRELMISTGVLCGLAAATLFLCARAEHAVALPMAQTGHAVAAPARALATASGASSLATPVAQAMQAADLVWRADRHAVDAQRLVDRAGSDDGLEWDFVQLRL